MTLRRGLAAIATGMAVATAAGCGGASTSTVTVTTQQVTTRQVTTRPAPKHHALTFPALVARVRSGVIRIETNTCDASYVGTGVLISPRLVATVDHVVHGSTSIDLKRSGHLLAHGTVIGADPGRDVALVRTDRPIAGYHFRFASRAPVLGESVAAIGYPYGLPLTVTRGSVSGSGRSLQIHGVPRRQLVQTDASVNPGNSGGPLMTNSGVVVGLVDLGTTKANGLAFAVSAKVVAPLIQAWTFTPQSAHVSCSTRPRQPTATPAQTAAPSPGTYSSGDFAMQYPSGWVVTHIPEGPDNFDTTFGPPAGGPYLIRVDENPTGGYLTPAQASAPVVSALRRQSSYVEISISDDEMFAGFPARRWEFLSDKNGVIVHEVDRFISDSSGRSWGILIEAPQSEWAKDGPILESYLATLVLT